MQLEINEQLGSISYEIGLASEAKATIVLAHGAGAGMHHPFMVQLAEELNKAGFHTFRFNFPYMEKGRKAPGSPKHATATWKAMANTVRDIYPDLPLFLSGKSYGGRMASHYCIEDNPDFINGLIYFGFPLHAPGKDSKDRASHLSEIDVPQLFLQGTKDKLANFQLITEVVENLSSATLIEMKDGDHSFNVPKASGKTKEEVIKKLAMQTSEWVDSSI